MLLTGTPLQNNLGELWALLNFILPGIFNCKEQFEEWFNKPFEDEADELPDAGTAGQSGGQAARKRRARSSGRSRDVCKLLSGDERAAIVTALQRVMKPFVLRRLKTDVMSDLPSKVCMGKDTGCGLTVGSGFCGGSEGRFFCRHGVYFLFHCMQPRLYIYARVTGRTDGYVSYDITAGGLVQSYPIPSHAVSVSL